MHRLYRPLFEQQQQQIADITTELEQLCSEQTEREDELQHTSQQHEQVKRKLAALTTAAATATDSSELQEQLAECEQQVDVEHVAVATATEQAQQHADTVRPLQQQCAAAEAELAAVQQLAAGEDEAYDVCCSATAALQKRTDAVTELLTQRRATAAAAHSTATSQQAHAQRLLSTAEAATRTLDLDWEGGRVTVNGKSPDSVKRSLEAARNALDAARREHSILPGDKQAAHGKLCIAKTAYKEQQRKLRRCEKNIKLMRQSLKDRKRRLKQLNK
jgi:chromosome segregation ATPase